MFTIDGCTLQYEIIGHGQPVILTPGGRLGGNVLRPLAEKIATSYQVVLWDRRNTGSSDVWFDGHQSEQEQWSDDLVALLEHLSMTSAYIGGGSAGCRNSLLTALRHPEVVKALLLWSPTGGPYACQVLGYNYHVPYIQAAQAGGMPAVAATPFFSELISANPSNLDRILSIEPSTFISVMRYWNEFFYHREGNPLIGTSTDQLQTIKAPTLIFQGEDDLHTPEASATLHQEISGSEILSSPWSVDEWSNLYTGKTIGSVMSLYERMADPMLEFLRRH